MVLTKSEKAALRDKLKNPRKSVKCPRCGGELKYLEKGASILVECGTKDCIFAGVRGI